MSRRTPALLAAMLAASCAPEPSGTATSEQTYKPLSQRLSENNGYTQDASGNWVPRTNKRSSFETTGASPYFKGSIDKDTYQTADYPKETWQGTKSRERQSYAGNTDGSRFKSNSGWGGMTARESGDAASLPAPYQTTTRATLAARESSRQRIAKPEDAETGIRRSVFQQPEIIDWPQQRSLSLEQSRGILGR
jgi:hypothetical protein